MFPLRVAVTSFLATFADFVLHDRVSRTQFPVNEPSERIPAIAANTTARNR